MAEDEMVRQHHQLNAHRFEQTLGDSDRGAWHAAVLGLPRVGHNLVTYQQQKKQERLAVSLPCKDTAPRWPSASQEEPSLGIQPHQHPDLGLPASRTMRND